MPSMADFSPEPWPGHQQGQAFPTPGRRLGPVAREFAQFGPGSLALWCHLPVLALLTPQSLSYTWPGCSRKVQAWGEAMALSFQEEMSPWVKKLDQAEP